MSTKRTNFDWLAERIGHQGDDCLKWPFATLPNGRGHLGHDGKIWRASRLMCTLAHGEPPTPTHQAAHLCGNGHLGCVNPRHLVWQTRSENQLDRRKHGTHRTSKYGQRGCLNKDQVIAIRAMKGKCPKAHLAKRYGVSEATIYRVLDGVHYKF